MATRKRKGGVPKRVQMTATAKAKSATKNKGKTPNQIAYEKELNNLNKRIENARKSGYVFTSMDFIPNKPDRIYKKDIEAIQEIRARKLWSNAMWSDPNTGSLIPGIEGMHRLESKRANKAKKTKQSKRPANRTNNTHPKSAYKHHMSEQLATETDPFFDDPDLHDIEDDYLQDMAHGGDIIVDNFLDEFVSRLSAPIDTGYTKMSGKRTSKFERVYDSQVTAQHNLLSLIQRKVEEEGKSQLGWRLQANADTLTDLINGMMYRASKVEDVEYCSREIAEIVNGEPLTMEQLMDLGSQDDLFQNWESPQ